MPRKNKTTDTAGTPQKVPTTTNTALGQRAKAAVEYWQRAVNQLHDIKKSEIERRVELAEMFIPHTSRVEGTNRLLGVGFEVQVGHTLTRKIDEAALPAILSAMPFEVTHGLIEYTPKLNLEKYRALSPEHRLFFDQCLSIKDDGAPTLTITLAEMGETGVAVSHAESPSAPEAKKTGKPPLPSPSIGASIAAPAVVPDPAKTIALSRVARNAPKANPTKARKSATLKAVRASKKPTAPKPAKSLSKLKTKRKK